jgi:Ca-activated chloride channel family protein
LNISVIKHRDGEPSMKRLGLAALALVGLFATSNPATAQTEPQTHATAGGTLHLDTRLSHGFVPIGKPATVYATVSIKAQAAGTSDRAPLNLALVVDRSSSMSGDKLAKAKEASHMLIDMLGEQDRLAIVSYGSDVTTEIKSKRVTMANKELLHNAVRSIRLRGSTNLSGGYERGRALVMAHNRDDTINRVLLLSDGHANVGVTQTPQLGAIARRGLDRGVSLTTMGIGLDYNETLMTEMAQQGAGNYYFIEKSGQIATMFETECKGLASTVARNTVVEIEMAPGVELLELRGFKFTRKGGTAKVKLAEFFGNQQKDILVKLAVSAQAEGSTPIITSKLRFDDVLRDDRRVQSSATLVAVATNDEVQHAKVDHDVLRRAQQIRTAVTFDEAMAEYERGNADKAAKIVAEQRAANQKFVKTYDFEDDVVDGFMRVDGELEEMEKDVRTTRASSKKGKRMRKATKQRAYQINMMDAAF